MSRRCTLLLLALSIFLAPLGSDGVALVAAQGLADFKTALPAIVREARRFQTPDQALYHWGDPQSIHGVMSPEIGYVRPRYGDMRWEITLFYYPPAHGLQRLRAILVNGLSNSPPPSEREIVAWLGTPISRNRDQVEGGWSLRYDGQDKPGLGVQFVRLSTSGMTVQL